MVGFGNELAGLFKGGSVTESVNDKLKQGANRLSVIPRKIVEEGKGAGRSIGKSLTNTPAQVSAAAKKRHAAAEATTAKKRAERESKYLAEIAERNRKKVALENDRDRNKKKNIFENDRDRKIRLKRADIKSTRADIKFTRPLLRHNAEAAKSGHQVAGVPLTDKESAVMAGAVGLGGLVALAPKPRPKSTFARMARKTILRR